MCELEAVVADSLKVDEVALSKGLLIVEFDWPINGEIVALQATYPDSFPRLRPIVNVRGDRSTFPERHCSPIDGNLCLLGRDTRQWRQKWTLRKLLESQLADALKGTGDADPQGEPAEVWWNCNGQRGSYCLIDSTWTLNGIASGNLKLRYRFRKKENYPEIKAVVTEVRAQDGTLLHSWNGPIPPEIEAGSNTITIPWIYIDEIILPNRTEKKIYDLIDRFPLRPQCTSFTVSTTGQWFAVVYKSELKFQTFGLGWLFPFLFGPKKAFSGHNRAQKKIPAPQIMIIPTYRAGEQDLGARVPAVRILRQKRIAVVGLGALGGPLAIELARNGCRRLHLLDHDVVEPGNSIRWPLGASAWGCGKTESLPEFVRREYPWTEVKEHQHAIGSVAAGIPEAGDDGVFETIMKDVNLVVDATASYGVSTVLSDYCRAHALPFISLYASPPVKGGVVVRFAPDSGCPTCLEFAHNAGTIERSPGFDSNEGLQQPPGCAELTFTGASYDLQELALQAMRLIVDTLENPGSPNTSVVYTLSLVSNDQKIPPAWRLDHLPKSEGCSCLTTP